MCCASCLAYGYGLGHYGHRYQITQQNIVSANLVIIPPFRAFSVYSLIIVSVVSAKLDTPPTPRELVSDSIKRSTVAHLFHFYPVLCEIASIPRHSPTAWVQASTLNFHEINYDNNGQHERDDGRAKGKLQKQENKTQAEAVDATVTATADEDVKGDVELNARTLARDCLKELGREMGISN